MRLTLHVWRQSARDTEGFFETHQVEADPDMSMLEMLDVVNEGLASAGRDPIAFDHDCREGICGMCGFMVNGIAHGPERATTVCQLHMRHFKDGDVLWLEPWRATPFPVLKDLCVDRSAFDHIIAAGGYVSVSTGSAPEANATPIAKERVDAAMDAAACIGCGACVAACPNGSAMLFMSSKVAHLGLLPQGAPERYDRVTRMVVQHDSEGFGNCTNIGECSAVCPKEIGQDVIGLLNRDLIKAGLTRGRKRAVSRD
ncbi:MAG: succinate dehydrogenase/fumarate reductase iron-sulfur subunit [Mycobacteriales bacterium]